MLLHPSFDSAVAERTVYPGFLFPKVLELKRIVLVVDCVVVLAAGRRQCRRLPLKVMRFKDLDFN